MKFTCDKGELQEACAISTRAVPAKSPLPALEGLLIEAADNKVTVTGYDLKKAVYTEIEANVYESGIILVEAKFFGEMLRRMSDGMLSIECDEKNNINAKCGKSDYNYSCMEFEEYPDLPEFEKVNYIELPQKILKNMINRTIFAISKDEVRPVYTGTLFEITDSELTLVSVDGFRLARKSEKIENGCMENCSFIVPGSTLSDVEKICQETDNPVQITVGEKHILFKIENTVVITRRLEGEFLNHRKSVPETFKYRVVIKKQELINVTERVALMLSDSTMTNPVRMVFEDGRIYCHCRTPMGKAEDICTCDGSADSIEIGFNDRYMLDALKAAETDTVALYINTATSPCVIKAADGSENFAYMILPVRLRA